jgi:uncharacterized protein (TIGR00299 family) protein
MKIAYLDLFSGLSGDMMLGALVDAGLPLAELKRGLAKLPLRGYALGARKVRRGAVAATKVDVRVAAHGHAHTPLKAILALLKRSGLPAAVKASAAEVFLALGRAEGRVHGLPPMKVEFHEVGSVDSIVDVAGACLGLHLLGVERLHCSRVPVGQGRIRMAHGVLPNPGPAALELLKGMPLRGVETERELVTPTGAALLAVLAREPGRVPDFTLEAVGNGAGSADDPERPNIVRLLLGSAAPAEEADVVALVETNLDNAPGELVGYLFDRLFAAGAVDVYTTPVQMKKSRPGVKVSVLAPPSRVRAVEEVLLRETPTFGLRRAWMERSKLDRREVEVGTAYGSIRVKEGRRGGKLLKANPEYEDVRKAAEAGGVPLQRVAEAAKEAHRKGQRHPHHH